MDLQQIGTAVKKARNERGITQKELAATLGMHKNRLSEIESGRVNYKLNTLLPVLKKLGLKMYVVMNYHAALVT